MENSFMTTADCRRFKSYMAGAGYTITALAKMLNMSRESLSARINGKVDFERTEMMEISRIFNASPSDIFFDL